MPARGWRKKTATAPTAAPEIPNRNIRAPKCLTNALRPGFSYASYPVIPKKRKAIPAELVTEEEVEVGSEVEVEEVPVMKPNVICTLT